MRGPDTDAGSLRPDDFQRIFLHANDAGFVLDPTVDRIVDANEKACSLLGYAREELLNTPISAIHPAEMAKLMAFTNSVLETGGGWTDELACLTKAGQHVPAEISASRVELDGQVRVVSWVRDLCERKEAERALQESEERFRTLFDTAADAIYLLNSEGRITGANEQASRDTGFKNDELLTMSVWDLAVGQSPERFLQMFERLSSGETLWVSSWHRRSEGSEFPVEIVVRQMVVGGRPFALAIARDLSERVKSERQRAEQRRTIEVLSRQTEYLRQEFEHPFEDVVVSSPALRKVFDDVSRVAATDATVLVCGETGTGKELVARAVHRASQRSDGVLVKVNCSALTAGLIESELFGHEKGAFTGALQRRTGRFELADGGTILLDEIGDLPLDLQAKLLRVLQEGEFERVGGAETLRVDVRVIAATNRDLETEVAEGRFRSDLYYRLRVFPLTVPPLRSRPEDIAPLAQFFVEKHAKRLGSSVARISDDALKVLRGHSWPGNVRELEHEIERALILSSGVELDMREWAATRRGASEEGASLAAAEGRAIVEALQRAGWKVSGQGGAAEILEIHPNTLRARMKRLGIRRP